MVDRHQMRVVVLGIGEHDSIAIDRRRSGRQRVASVRVMRILRHRQFPKHRPVHQPMTMQHDLPFVRIGREEKDSPFSDADRTDICRRGFDLPRVVILGPPRRQACGGGPTVVVGAVKSRPARRGIPNRDLHTDHRGGGESKQDGDNGGGSELSKHLQRNGEETMAGGARQGCHPFDKHGPRKSGRWGGHRATDLSRGL